MFITQKNSSVSRAPLKSSKSSYKFLFPSFHLEAARHLLYFLKQSVTICFEGTWTASTYN